MIPTAGLTRHRGATTKFAAVLKFDFATEQVNRGVGNLSGIVIGVGADADGTNDRQPSRYRATGKALRYLLADHRQYRLEHSERWSANENALADTDDDIPQRLSSGMTEEAEHHLLSTKMCRLTECARNVRYHLRLNLPYRNEFGDDCHVSEWPWRQRQRS